MDSTDVLLLSRRLRKAGSLIFPISIPGHDLTPFSADTKRIGSAFRRSEWGVPHLGRLPHVTEGRKTIETHRVNEQIRIAQVRVVNHLGEMVGVVPTVDALRLAYDAGMDLVEVAPTERPPVCRIMDYGKFKYEQKRKLHKNNKVHQVELKEIRLRPKIGDHDIDFKTKHAREFLTEKDKVKLTVVFRGRENAHQDLGRDVLMGMIAKLEDIAKIEKAPSMEGRAITAVLAPK